MLTRFQASRPPRRGEPGGGVWSRPCSRIPDRASRVRDDRRGSKPTYLGVIVAALAVSLAAAGAPPAFAADQAYLLGSQDKVRIKVYEWRAAKGEAYEWAALNGEFIVGADGDLALPLV